MTEEAKFYIEETEEAMKKAISHLEGDLQKIRAGKASPALVDGIFVDYYGSETPLNQVSNINTSDAKTLNIQPWEKAMLPEIEKAILQANIGLTPQNDGEFIRLILPPLTEERRIELVKNVKSVGESAKISLRNSRRDGIESIKKLQKDGLSEDLAKDAEDAIDKMTKTYTEIVQKHLEAKESKIMQV